MRRQRKNRKIISNNGNFNEEEKKRKTLKEFRFFWKANKNPFNANEKAIWAPFDKGDQLFLEKEYQNYLNQTIS